ncbi:MAG: hypothetical protein ABIO24_01060, partial [Saprospiraceae bacterium]
PTWIAAARWSGRSLKTEKRLAGRKFSSARFLIALSLLDQGKTPDGLPALFPVNLPLIFPIPGTFTTS